MGFNKRYVNSEFSILALKNNNLRGYYGKSDCLFFEDQLSSYIYELFKQGKTDKEILSIINQNMEEKTYEVY
jgi:hypothetical protein